MNNEQIVRTAALYTCFAEAHPGRQLLAVTRRLQKK
jgi:hypothetical protein